MKSIKSIAMLAALLPVALNAAPDGIEWKHTELPIEVQQGSSIRVAFPFRITGDEPVGITSLKTSSSRVTVDTSIVGEHKPGTSGILKVRYVPGNADSGRRVEKITVTTTDARTPEVELRLRVRSTLVYRLESGDTLWHVGADPVAKDVYFTDIAGNGSKPVAVSSRSENFTATLIPPEGKSFRYIIRIKPVSTSAAGYAHVVLDVDMGDGTMTRRGIVAMIRDQNNPNARLPRFDDPNNTAQSPTP